MSPFQTMQKIFAVFYFYVIQKHLVFRRPDYFYIIFYHASSFHFIFGAFVGIFLICPRRIPERIDHTTVFSEKMIAFDFYVFVFD